MEVPVIRADGGDVFEMSRATLDTLPFGVVTLDRKGMILRFNREQETLARRECVQTVGLDFFNDVAPCTNVHDFRGRFDSFARHFDSGVERFAFSFAFRWGRQDMSITLLRKAERDEINILVRGQSKVAVPSAPAEAAGDGSTISPREAARAHISRPGEALPQSVLYEVGNAPAAALATRVHADDLEAVRSIVEAAVRDQTSYVAEYRGIHGFGKPSVFQEHGHYIAGSAGFGSAVIIDITEQRRNEIEIWRAAFYDPLTGLPNQKSLNLRIAEAIEDAERGGRMAAVVLVDIDRFRNVNDAFGYDIGNEILRAVALRLGECVQYGDTVARLAADSFAVLLSEAESAQSVEDTATRIIAAVTRPLVVRDRSFNLAVHLGISLAPQHSRDSVRLLHAASTAVCSAKAASRNVARFYTRELASEAVNRLEYHADLRAALANDEFELMYQPLVDIARHRVVAAEALVRWRHPTRGMIPPLEFIPLADSTGLIVPLGEWILREACSQARRWADAGLDVRVCVNVSTIQFQRPGFVDLVASILAQWDLEPRLLELELTESIMVDGFGEMIETLAQLKTLGVRLAIDDFGTGYSSLSYLKYFPVDTLKIDRSFITDIVSDNFDQAIAAAIFRLTEKFDLECVIEGVETAEQLALLTHMGCTIIQGYFFCRPMPPDKLTALLSAGTIGAAQFALQRPPDAAAAELERSGIRD